jgi:hypothetical protein
MAEGLDLREPPALCTCEACLKGQMIKAPHKGHIKPRRYLDELIYIDTIRPLKPAKDRSLYFIYFYYNKTKEAEYYTIKHKSKALEKFKLF